ncbi:MAG: ribbon-helix-helix protein, CopG family [Chloroflexota bacterium]|nr:ribbon-helix-helix protein, CopG family [Chloroflexota bacterium]
MTKPISLRLDDQLAGQLATIAALTDRPKTWHIEQALRDYLARETEFLEAVDAGIRAEEAGDMVDHAVILEDMRARRERRNAATQ